MTVKLVVGQRQHAELGLLVRLGVGGQRVGRGFLVGNNAVRLETVDAAGGRQDVALHAGLLGQFRAAHPRLVIDGPGHVLEQFAAGIVGDGGQIDDGIDTGEIGNRQAAYVLADHLQVRMGLQEFVTEKEPVDRTHGIALLEQHRNQGSADITAGAGDHHTLHNLFLGWCKVGQSTGPRFPR